MNNQNAILKCFKYFNILYSQPIFNRYTKITSSMKIEYKNLMFHHATENYYIFWNGEKYIRLFKIRVLLIEEC